MLDNLDELIELNLKLLYNAPNMYMWRINFENEKGQKLQDSLRFAKILDKKGLIDLEPKEKFRCELTELGREIVIGNGWIKYSQMEKENKLKEHNKISTIIAEKYIAGDNYENISSQNLNINSNNPITNNTTSNPNNDLKANSIMLKFWKLISENKLISGLLLVIILWAIKEIFGINLKN
jgi:hypothetical protein